MTEWILYPDPDGSAVPCPEMVGKVRAAGIVLVSMGDALLAIGHPAALTEDRRAKLRRLGLGILAALKEESMRKAMKE